MVVNTDAKGVSHARNMLLIRKMEYFRVLGTVFLVG
jgi:hypothetical protein